MTWVVTIDTTQITLPQSISNTHAYMPNPIMLTLVSYSLKCVCRRTSVESSFLDVVLQSPFVRLSGDGSAHTTTTHIRLGPKHAVPMNVSTSENVYAGVLTWTQFYDFRSCQSGQLRSPISAEEGRMRTRLQWSGGNSQVGCLPNVFCPGGPWLSVRHR